MGDRQPLRLSARRHPAARLYRGRAPVVAIPCQGLDTIVVRPCFHGGFWGILTQDIYLSSSRARREIIRSQWLQDRKIPTPSILAVLFYPAGPGLRIDVVTAAIPNSMDFVSFLSSSPSAADRKGALGAIRSLFSRLHHHGIVHPDLNARNILLSRRPRSPWQAWVLDVDAIRIEEAGHAKVDQSNRHRLLRSLLKRARRGDLGLPASAVPALWRELFP